MHSNIDGCIDRWMDRLGQNRLQVCFFSATLHSPQIKQLADSICVNPTWVDLRGIDDDDDDDDDDRDDGDDDENDDDDRDDDDGDVGCGW